MNIGYADPPYPGMAKQHYGDQPDYAGEVDHAQLIESLTSGYDGFVLHTGSAQMQDVLALCPPVRVLAWVKGWASFKPGVSVKYAWEPVFLWNARKRPKGTPLVRDWFMHNVTTGQPVPGAKPERVCHWIFECMGLQPDEDELDDLFPGTGAVTRAWQRWCAERPLPTLGSAA